MERSPLAIRYWLILLCSLLSAIAWPSSSDFDGSTSVITITTQSAIATTAFSVGCWIRQESDGGGGYGHILNSYEAAADGWEIRQNGTSSTDYLFWAYFTTTNGRWTIARPSQNTWVHFLLTYDGASASNAPVVYYNGVSQTVTLVLAAVGTFNVTTNNLLIGMGPSAGNMWDGQLAECFYYDRVLSANEAKAVAYCGPKSVPRSLIGYWPLGVFSGRNYTTTTGLNGSATAITELHNGPPIAYVQGLPCDQ